MDYQMKVMEYTKHIKVRNAYVHEWEDNGPRLFNLILHHCPPTLVLKMEGQQQYENCKDYQDPVALLVILRDVTHKHDATNNSAMAIVKSDMELYLSFQGKTDLIDGHY